jgi:hypothetical protein
VGWRRFRRELFDPRRIEIHVRYRQRSPRVGVTIGGHVASAPFTIHGTSYEISLLAFGQPGNAPDPLYEGEPSDPTIDFKGTLKEAWGAHYSFNYTGGFTGDTAISARSYSVKAIQQTADQVSFGCDLFLVYEPGPASSDPPITADLRWIELTHTGGRSSTEFAQRACPYYFPGALTSVYGKPACSFYGAPGGGIGAPTEGRGATTAKGPTPLGLVMFESFLVLDTGRKDHAGKGIIDILGGPNGAISYRRRNHDPLATQLVIAIVAAICATVVAACGSSSKPSTTAGSSTIGMLDK